MKQLIAFVKKEFYHIMRDYRTLLVLFGMPIVQIVLFGFALSNEVKNARVAVFDQSRDVYTQQLKQKITESKYFDITKELSQEKEIEEVLRKGEVNLVIIFPQGFMDDLNHQRNAQVQFISDGMNPNLSTTVLNYASAITMDFQSQISGVKKFPYQIDVVTKMLYNPQLAGAYIFVPGVIALVLMLVCTMMTSVSIVREKELGNMEILLVSPIRPFFVIISKAIPYIFLSLGILTTILLLSKYLLDVPIRGSLPLLYGVSLVFIITSLSLGLLISSFTNSQQTAMLISLMGLMLPTMMFSGFMFPIENMPLPLRTISNLVPAKWYFLSIKAIMIKGLGLSSIAREVLILTGFGIFFLGLSLAKFKTRLA